VLAAKVADDLVDVDHDDLLDGRVAKHLARGGALPPTGDEDALWVGVVQQRRVDEQLVVDPLVDLGGLDFSVEEEGLFCLGFVFGWVWVWEGRVRVEAGRRVSRGGALGVSVPCSTHPPKGARVDQVDLLELGLAGEEDLLDLHRPLEVVREVLLELGFLFGGWWWWDGRERKKRAATATAAERAMGEESARARA
jgi:hypothetical protein